jgi:hypothetical protein
MGFVMKLDPATKHFICKRCGLYATREQVSDIRYKLSRKESTKSDKQYDYLDWWQKSKKDKEAQYVFEETRLRKRTKFRKRLTRN